MPELIFYADIFALLWIAAALSCYTIFIGIFPNRTSVTRTSAVNPFVWILKYLKDGYAQLITKCFFFISYMFWRNIFKIRSIWKFHEQETEPGIKRNKRAGFKLQRKNYIWRLQWSYFMIRTWFILNYVYQV